MLSVGLHQLQIVKDERASYQFSFSSNVCVKKILPVSTSFRNEITLSNAAGLWGRIMKLPLK